MEVPLRRQIHARVGDARLLPVEEPDKLAASNEHVPEPGIAVTDDPFAARQDLGTAIPRLIERASKRGREALTDPRHGIGGQAMQLDDRVQLEGRTGREDAGVEPMQRGECARDAARERRARPEVARSHHPTRKERLEGGSEREVGARRDETERSGNRNRRSAVDDPSVAASRA